MRLFRRLSREARNGDLRSVLGTASSVMMQLSVGRASLSDEELEDLLELDGTLAKMQAPGAEAPSTEFGLAELAAIIKVVTAVIELVRLLRAKKD